MSVKLSKYRVIDAMGIDDLEDKMSALADEGYILAELITKSTYTFQDGSSGGGGYCAVMKIDEGNYEGVVNLRDVAPELVDECLEKGWSICSTSLSTKFTSSFSV